MIFFFPYVFAATDPSARTHGYEPSRIVPPFCVRPFCVVMRSITGCGVSGFTSVELAPFKPQTWRANSITAICIPKQMPKKGTRSSRAQRTAAILPSVPRGPKPIGTSTPSTSLIAPSPSFSTTSESTYSSSTAHSLAMPPCASASLRLLYESTTSTYLPTTAIRTRSFGLFATATIFFQRPRLGVPVQMFRRSAMRCSFRDCRG